MSSPAVRQRFRPWLVDAAFGLGVTLVLAVVITANRGGSRDPDLVAYLWAVGLGALMLARRRYPRAVLFVTAFGLFAYYAAGYPAVGVAVPVAAALYAAAEAGRLGSAVLTAALVVAVSLTFRLVDGQDPTYVVGYELVSHLGLIVTAVALGDSVRSRRVEKFRQRELAALTAAEYARQARYRVQTERLTIARDLHDSVGHAVSVISLHADVATEALGHDEPAAATALARIRSTAAHTLRDLRSTVAVLRATDGTAHDLISVRDLDRVLEPAHLAGMDVTVLVDPAAATLPAPVDAAAYRIVQEAVTNAVRHSGGARVDVQLRVAGADLLLTVSDDGPGRSMTPTPTDLPEDLSAGPAVGHGIAGMAERARALGGILTVDRSPDGCAVRARIPIGASR
ncbi:sensor histidine kinase [Micromonospora sp. Llam0]|uniref:sensor histidine kinase n=1 Tax=Micromonospora sp. Llam0 TaxID=2485143 RepID=UPI000F49D99D|nr:histidine kinase [Micromonospora sp. Llam0]